MGKVPTTRPAQTALGSRRLLLIGASIALSVIGASPIQAGQSSYTIAAGDTLQVNVYGDAGLSGRFPVGSDGSMVYPLVGSIAVAGKTAQEIAAILGKSLSEHVPNASVTTSIAEYGPVFVLGDVRTPGKYEYRPGMIALELLAMAGGAGHLENNPDAAALQLITTRQEYADLELQMFALEIRRQRVQAEMDQTDLSYPSPHISDPVDQATRQDLVTRELTLFTTRRNAFIADQKAFTAQEASYADEIRTINESMKLHNDEIALLVEDVDAAKSLADRGLTAKSNLRQTERELSSTRRDALELQTYLARAQQNRLAIQQRKTAMLDQLKTDSAAALQAIDLELARMTRKQAALLSAMVEIASTAGKAAAAARDTRMVMTVTRGANGQYEQIAADDRLEIRPGDILRVEFGVPQASRQASVN
jgi:polysaccharide export outer membrane protein